MARGTFVTFEGGEGTGKSTQLRRLAARLIAAGHEVVETREPGGTPLAERVRELLLDPDPRGRPNAWSEAFLMEAARADLVAEVIEPALERGAIVLCDRYADSTLAYQGGGRGLDSGVLEAMNQAATGGLEPGLTFLFDLDPQIGLERRGRDAAGANRIDRESLEFHRRVRERYLVLARSRPARWVVIDAARAPEALERSIFEEVERRRAAAAPTVRGVK